MRGWDGTAWARTWRWMLWIALLGWGGGQEGWADQPEGASGGKRRIVLVSTKPDHPWASHMYGQECGLLAKCLNQNEGVEAIVSPELDWPADEGLVRGAAAVVYYSRPAGDILLAPARRDFIKQQLDRGLGLVCIHWSTAADDLALGPPWLEALGGWFHFQHCGLKVDRRPLVQRWPEHPICRGWKPYDLRDEFYLNLKFHERTVPVLTVDVDGVEQTVAWSLEREDGGRSFGTTLGHFHDNFEIEAFRRALVNGILWAAGIEVPAEGARVAATADDLDLGPAPAESK